MIKVLLTILLLVVLTVGIRKKLNVATLLFSLGIVSLMGYTLITGVSVADTTSGSLFFDVFELIVETFKSRFAAMLIITMSVIGYSSYMNHIGASKALADVLVKPVSRVKNKYILLAFTALIVFLMIFAVPSPTSVIMLLFGTLVPILVQVGVPIEGICATMVCSSCIVSGPSNPHTLLAAQELGVLDQMDIATFAFSRQIIIAAISCVAMMFLCPLSNYVFDKKDNVVGRTELKLNTDVEYKEATAPRFYAVLPVLPLMLIVIFSRLVVGNISISVVSAQFLCLLLVMVIDKFVRKQTWMQAFEDTSKFYFGMGNYIGGQGMIPVAGAFFAAGIAKIGGLDIVVGALADIGFGFFGMMFLVGGLGAVCSFITADSMGSLSIVLPVAVTVVKSAASSNPALAVVGTCILLQAPVFGSAMSIVFPSTLMLSSLTDVQITNIVKRNVIPAIGTLLITIISAFLLLS